jgi:hypothetical protein
MDSGCRPFFVFIVQLQYVKKIPLTIWKFFISTNKTYLITFKINRSQEYSKFIDKSIGTIYNKFAINAFEVHIPRERGCTTAIIYSYC